MEGQISGFRYYITICKHNKITGYIASNVIMYNIFRFMYNKHESSLSDICPDIIN